MNTANLSTRRHIIAASGVAIFGGVAGATPFSRRIQSALAQDSGRAVRFINSNNVNLRTGAGLDFSIITTLDTSERVEVIDRAGRADGYEWVNVEVTSSGRTGFVALDFLSRSTGEGEASDFPIGSLFVVDTVDGSAANLRSAPGTSAGIVRTVANGLEGEIRSGPTSAEGYRWFQVTIDGSEGFLADIVIASPDGSPSFDPWPIGSRVVVVDGPLNLRTEPFGDIVSTYQIGSLATVIDEPFLPASGDGYVWYPVETDDGNVGVFASDFIDLTDDDGGGDGEPSGEVVVIDGPLNVRSTANGDIVGTISTGSYGALTGDETETTGGYQWVRVRFYTSSGLTGWVAVEFIDYL